MPHINTPRGTLWIADHRSADAPTPPLLLIHGAGGTHLDWSAPIRKLNHIAVDLNGHGRSEGAGHDHIADHAADLVALLDALELPRVILVGHSMGGAIALSMALDAADRVAALALISTGARLRVHPDLLNVVAHNPEQVARRLFDQSWLWGVSVSREIKEMGRKIFLAQPPVVIARDYAACDNFDIRQRLPDIHQPTLVLCGTADQMTPPRFSHYLADNIPNARLRLYGDAGHMLPIERADEVAQALREFAG